MDALCRRRPGQVAAECRRRWFAREHFEHFACSRFLPLGLFLRADYVSCRRLENSRAIDDNCHSVAQSRPFDLLVFPFWTIFRGAAKRLTFYFWVLWASEVNNACREQVHGLQPGNLAVGKPWFRKKPRGPAADVSPNRIEGGCDFAF